MKMSLSKLIKREIIITVFSVILLSMGVMFFSYSYFMDVDEGNTNVISFGDISLSFCATSDCNNMSGLGNLMGTKIEDDKVVPAEIYPLSDEVGLQTDPYKFVVTNTGKYKLYMDFVLKPDNSYYSEGYEAIDYSQIKVSIKEENISNPIATTKIFSQLLNGVILSDEVIEPGETKIYSLRSWVKEDALNTIQKTYFVVKLNINASYKPDVIV